jgi:hypothetical protein
LPSKLEFKPQEHQTNEKQRRSTGLVCVCQVILLRAGHHIFVFWAPSPFQLLMTSLPGRCPRVWSASAMTRGGPSWPEVHHRKLASDDPPHSSSSDRTTVGVWGVSVVGGPKLGQSVCVGGAVHETSASQNKQQAASLYRITDVR